MVWRAIPAELQLKEDGIENQETVEATEEREAYWSVEDELGVTMDVLAACNDLSTILKSPMWAPTASETPAKVRVRDGGSGVGGDGGCKGCAGGEESRIQIKHSWSVCDDDVPFTLSLNLRRNVFSKLLPQGHRNAMG